ncbi:MAG: glycosyltransferase [Actinomycetota bacterium]
MANGLVRRHAPTVVTALAFVASIVVAWLWLDIDSVERVSRDAGVVGPLLFFAAYVVAMIALVPSTPFNLAAGAIFGPVVGLLVAVAGALTSAFVTVLARGLPGVERLRRRVEDSWPRMARRLGEARVSHIAALRLFPIVPFGVVSYAAAISRTSRRPFAIGTIVATPIGLAPFVFLGASGERALSGETFVPLAASLSMLGALVVGGAWVRRNQVRESDVEVPASVEQAGDTDLEWSLPVDLPAQELVDVSVVFPTYNEAERFPGTLLDTVSYLRERGTSFEIVVADDGSTDTTIDVVRKMASIAPEVRLVASPRNFGKGYAVRTGVANARGRRVLFADADGSTPIEEIERLEAALDAGADVAIGSRSVESDEVDRTRLAHRAFASRVFNWLVSTLLLPGLEDTQCGFKMFERDAASAIFGRQRLDGFSFDVEILFIARRLGLETAEVAINWADTPGSKVRIVRDSARMVRDTGLIMARDLTGRYRYAPGTMTPAPNVDGSG